MLCEPKKLCPKRIGVSYDKIKNKCFDFFQGIFIDPIAASPPIQSETIEVAFYCEHGRVIIYNGK